MQTLASDFVEPPDEWEVNLGNMTLLEKLGGGFFGVVYRAYLYQSSSGGSSRQARKEKISFENEKLVVACKMLKGMYACFSIYFRFLLMIESINICIL